MDTKWNSTGPDEGLEQLVAGEVREALKGVEDAPGVAKVRVSGKTCGRLRAAAGLAALVLGVSLVLGSLGQSIELARVLPAGHQVVSRALRSTFNQSRSLNLKEAFLC